MLDNQIIDKLKQSTRNCEPTARMKLNPKKKKSSNLIISSYLAGEFLE